VFLQVNWSFRAPGRPGDTITAEVEVLELHHDQPIATLRTTITNQHGDTLIDGTAVVYRDPSLAGIGMGPAPDASAVSQPPVEPPLAAGNVSQR
jgi:hypothetical protein